MLIAISVATAYANPRDDGFYTGISAGVIKLGGDSYEETSISTGTSNTTTYKDVESSSLTLKIGYQHFKNNRVEIYRRRNDIDTDSGKVSSDTVGINYEWGFSSLTAPNNKKLLPYISFGYGKGSASTNSTRLKLVSTDASEVELGLGVHYQIGRHLDTTIGYYHRSTSLDDNHIPTASNNFFDANATTNSIEAGVSYHF